MTNISTIKTFFTQGISKLQRKALILLPQVAVLSLKSLKGIWGPDDFHCSKNGSVVEFHEKISTKRFMSKDSYLGVFEALKALYADPE